MKINWEKLLEFEADSRNLSLGDLRKKWPENPINRYLSGGTELSSLARAHWTHTLRAHAHGRIHAKQIGKRCRYAPPVLREKGSGQTYPLLEKTFLVNVTTLEEQANLLGVEFLNKLS